MAYQYRARKSRTERITDRRVMGDEPAEGSDLTSPADFQAALNWYTRCSEHSERQEWVIEVIVKLDLGSDKEARAAVRSPKLMNNAGSIARMLLRDCDIPEDSQERWEANIEEAIDDGVGRKEERSSKINRRLMNPAARNRAKALLLRANIDELFDRVWEGEVNPKEINFFNVFRAWNMKGKQARILVPIYELQLAEYNDPEVMYAKSTPVKTLQAFVRMLCDSLRSFSKMKERSDEPARGRGRPKNVRRPIAATINLKYKASDDETKIVSIDPKSLLGASMAVLYNAKYRQLHLIRAASVEGLSVKGTTILNEDPASSSGKRAGRHVSTIRDMATMTKTQALRAFHDIESTDIEYRTRTSEDVLLVKAWR